MKNCQMRIFGVGNGEQEGEHGSHKTNRLAKLGPIKPRTKDCLSLYM